MVAIIGGFNVTNDGAPLTYQSIDDLGKMEALVLHNGVHNE